MRSRFGSDALPITLDIAEAAARLRAAAKWEGRVLTVADALIAATAATHGLTLATRNDRDFTDLSVAILNPFAAWVAPNRTAQADTGAEGGAGGAAAPRKPVATT